MSFNIILQYNTSDTNVLDKMVGPIVEVTGTLRRESSIIRPIIEFEGTLPTNCNYMTIPQFGRSYFVDDIISTGNNRFEIHAHVDVLTTYKNEIRACTGIIARQEFDWNLYVDDGVFKIYSNRILDIKKFPSGFNTQEFVLAVAGG